MAIIQLRKDAANLLGITPRQLGEWKHEDGFPDCSNGYDVDAIAKWREERNRKGSAKSEIDQQLRRALLAEKLKPVITCRWAGDVPVTVTPALVAVAVAFVAVAMTLHIVGPKPI